MAQDLRKRTQEFALRIIRLYSSFPSSIESNLVTEARLKNFLQEASELTAIVITFVNKVKQKQPKKSTQFFLVPCSLFLNPYVK